MDRASEPAPRTLFLGSGTFAVPILEALLGSPVVDAVGVVTAPPRPAGRDLTLRPTPVAQLAASRGLATLTPTRLRDDAVLAELARLDPALIVLADYGRLVPAALLDLPRHGALNVHPSLLPRHRGATPVVAAILAGDRATGVTLFRMDEGLDTGPIVATRRVALAGDEVAPDLEARLAGVGADLLRETLPEWLAGGLTAVPQPETGATLTRPLRREDGRLDPTRPARQLERQVRAYQPWPGSFVDDGPTRLVVWRASVADGPGPTEPIGAILPEDDTLALVTAEGRLRLDEVQPAGRGRMSGAAYRRGRRPSGSPAASNDRRR